MSDRKSERERCASERGEVDHRGIGEGVARDSLADLFFACDLAVKLGVGDSLTVACERDDSVTRGYGFLLAVILAVKANGRKQNTFRFLKHICETNIKCEEDTVKPVSGKIYRMYLDV